MSVQSKLSQARDAIAEGHRVSVIGGHGITRAGPTRNLNDVEQALQLNPHCEVRIEGEVEAAPEPVAFVPGSLPMPRRAPPPKAPELPPANESKITPFPVAIPTLVLVPIVVPSVVERPIFDPKMIEHVRNLLGVLDEIELAVAPVVYRSDEELLAALRLLVGQISAPALGEALDIIIIETDTRA